MRTLFTRKPIGAHTIGDLPIESEQPGGLKRTLGAGDLVLLAIGAVIGAGIFSSIGTAAAGEILPDGTIVRYGAGPALVLSFVLLGAVCALAALCYAELAAMIPQAGSAYAYSYATLGELVAWMIGWDLILEYAVGNIAVAIAWAGYFNSLLTGFGMDLPGWLTHGYWDVMKSSDPAVRAIVDTAPRVGDVPLMVNVPAFLIVMLVTWLLVIGVRESARANMLMVIVKLAVLALFVVVGAMHIDPANYEPSGADFLSAALSEAELMSRVIGPDEYPAWLGRFLPGLADGQPATLFQPATVLDVTDGQIAHLHGLNLSRAWAFTALAARLPETDARIAPLLAAAEHHADASLPFVSGSDYMVEHWLAAYATLLLS